MQEYRRYFISDRSQIVHPNSQEWRSENRLAKRRR